MLPIIGAALAGVPIVFIPLMKLALTGKNPPRWLKSGMVSQTLVVVLLCCFIVGATIAIQHFAAIKKDDVPFVSLISEFAIFIIALILGALIVFRTQRRGAESD